MSNLIKLLQPKEYKSKIKLFCREKEFKTEKLVQKFAQLKDNEYICKRRVKIEEYGEQT